MLPHLAGQIGQPEEEHVMAHSARILALFQKIEAADAAHFARLRERAKKDTAARAATLSKKRASLPVAQAVQMPSARRKRPPRKKSPLGEAT